MAERVQLVEVGPRDGLQNETRQIPTADKIALINSLLNGIKRLIELFLPRNIKLSLSLGNVRSCE